jgi:mono/diheme cytochrome c family protein
MRKALIAVTLALGTSGPVLGQTIPARLNAVVHRHGGRLRGLPWRKSGGRRGNCQPAGAYYASNITPDTRTGIGGWSEEQLRDALRKGRAPGKGWLYPAMPYTSYTGINDADVSALYAYLQSVPAVNHEVRATDLGFLFIRPAMIAWNVLYLKEGHAAGEKPAHGESAERGRYLVEALGHCSACHTPRGVLMAELPEQHLGGAFVGGWQALTSLTTNPGWVAGAIRAHTVFAKRP